MTKIIDVIAGKRNQLIDLAAKHGVNNIRIFGSAIRGDDTANSDIDLLVHFEDGRSIYDFIEFKLDAEEMFGRKVDVVSDRAINHLLEPYILSDAREL